MSLVLVLTLAVGQAPERPVPDLGRRPELARELEEMVRVDQETRTRVFGRPGPPDAAAVEALRKVDGRHTERLKALVAEHGWPGRTLVGTEGAHAAWLLVQHADHDRPFQKACLEKMQKAPAGEVDGRDLAYLTDRVLAGDGKPQRYGTQLVEKGGKLVPQPIEDPDGVDARRKAVGLPSLAEYLRFAEESMRAMRRQAGPKPAP